MLNYLLNLEFDKISRRYESEGNAGMQLNLEILRSAAAKIPVTKIKEPTFQMLEALRADSALAANLGVEYRFIGYIKDDDFQEKLKNLMEGNINRAIETPSEDNGKVNTAIHFEVNGNGHLVDFVKIPNVAQDILDSCLNRSQGSGRDKQ